MALRQPAGPRRSPSETDEAIRRRLALLSAELAAARPAAPVGARRVADDAAALDVDDSSAGYAEGGAPGETLVGDPEWLAAIEPWPEPPVRREPLDEVPARHEPGFPGRHARRRGVGGLLQRCRDSVSIGGRFSATHLAVIAVVLALGVAGAAWWVLHSAPVELAGPPREVAPRAEAGSGAGQGAEASPIVAINGSGAGGGGSNAGAATEIVVDVAGKVRRPGIAVLAPGARVVDALEAAGGVRRGVDLSSLNLARLLIDGEQILVGIEPPSGIAAQLTVPGTAPAALVNLNTAAQAELETLPGVGPVTATAIITWRTAHQGFGAVEELLEVDGIGDATLARLAPLVTV